MRARTLALLLALGSVASARADAARDALRARLDASWDLTRDAGTGRPRRLIGGAVALLPASVLAAPPAERDAKAVAAVLGFLSEHASELELEPDVLRPASVPVVASGSRLLVVHLDVAPAGVPVRGGRIVAALSRGNLVYVHLTGTAPVLADPTPSVGPDVALEAALVEAGLPGTAQVLPRPSPRLSFVPEGQGHRLAWIVTLIEREAPRRRVAVVDAATAQVVSLTDETVQACGPPPIGGSDRRILGAVRAERADDVERTELLAFATVSGSVSGVDGHFAAVPGPATGSLVGPSVGVGCTGCTNPAAASADASPDGDVDFGSGGLDAVGNGWSTPSERTAFFHVEAIMRLGARWLGLPWLSEPLAVNVNLPSACNAYWDGSSLNFFRRSGACANTGEIRDVISHEWGHGLDDNDGLEPPGLAVDGATGEAVADIAALLRSRDSCIGDSFFLSTSSWPSDTCSGVRDVDELAPGHEHGTMTTGNVVTACGSSAYYRGPLGREGHCEGEILGQAAWHLVQSLITGVPHGGGAPLPDGPRSADAAWLILEELFFGSRPLLASYAPSSLQAIGASAHDAFLVADDEGDGIANGTPHAAAIHEAFSHHGITEPGLDPPDTAGCVPPADPSPSVTAGIDPATGRATLHVQWPAVAGATALHLLRADEPDDAYLPLASLPPAATAYADRGVLASRAYRYRLLAEGPGGCLSPGAVAVTATPGVALRVVAVRLLDPPPADGDGVLEAGETAEAWVDVENVGSAPATFASVTLESEDPGVVITFPGPIAYGSIAPGTIVPAPSPFRVTALASAPRFARLVVAVDASEGCLRAARTVELGMPDVSMAGHELVDLGPAPDGTWAPGESAELRIPLANHSLVSASRVTGTLAFSGAPPAGVTLTVASASWPALAGDGTPAVADLPHFELAADATVPPRTRVPLAFDVAIAGAPHRSFALEVEVGAFPRGELKWEHATPGGGRYFTTPLLLQLNDDDGDGAITGCDVADVVVVSQSGSLGAFIEALSGDTGEQLWLFSGAGAAVVYDAAIAGGDIDGDGRNEIVIADSTSRLTALRDDGSIEWQVDARPQPATAASYPTPQVWDLDGDGDVEVVLGLSVHDGRTGARLWRGDGSNTGRCLVGDLDLDGCMEIMAGDGTTTRVYDCHGNDTGLGASFPGFYQNGAFVNLDRDPLPEIVWITRDWLVEAARLDGTRLWTDDTLRRSPHQRTPTACFGDFDSDGFAEVAMPGPDELFTIDDGGKGEWSVVIDDSSCCSGCSTFDFDLDDVPEIVYRDEENLIIVDGRTGARLWQSPAEHPTAKDVPAIGDLDHDGHAEILVNNAGTTFSLMCFTSPHWPPARPVWNQEDYSVTHVEDDGSIVSRPTPRWLGANDLRGQDRSCACTGPFLAFSWTVPNCDVPAACFEASAAGGLGGVEVSWDFGDGGPPSTSLTPCHAFSRPGLHAVTLSAVDGAGCEARVSQLVDVAPAPTVDFPAGSACASQETCFAANVADGVAPFDVAWDWGDGSPLEPGSTACHAFPLGSFDVTCFVRDARGCLAQATRRWTMPVDAARLPEVSGRWSGRPLLVDRNAGVLGFRFEDTGHEAGLYVGEISGFRLAQYTHVASGECAIAGGVAALPSPAFDAYFLVVGSACTPSAEGPYGHDSRGTEQPAAPPGSRCP